MPQYKATTYVTGPFVAAVLSYWKKLQASNRQFMTSLITLRNNSNCIQKASSIIINIHYSGLNKLLTSKLVFGENEML